MSHSVTTRPLKHFVDPARPITYGIVQAGPHIVDGVPYIRPVDMDGHGGVKDPSALLRTVWSIADQYRRSSVREGDLVVSIGPSYGKTMVIPRALSGANLTQGTARVAPASHVDAGYLRWALQSPIATDHWDNAVGGATFRALNLGPLAQTPVPDQPVPNQRAIADFLDAETAGIDALIAKKRRLAAALDERLRLYARLMTTREGNWQPLRRCVGSVKTGTTPPSGDFEALQGDDEAWYSPGDVGARLEMGLPARRLSHRAVTEGWVPRFPAGSTLVVGIGATAGRVGHASDPATGNQQMTCITAGPRLRSRFLSWQLWARSDELRATAPFTTLPILNNDFLRSFEVCVPSLRYQDEAASSLDRSSSTAGSAIAALSRQVDLLVEHRQALIAAAVTGTQSVPIEASSDRGDNCK